MRRLLSSLILALLLPATANAAVRVSTFYYPWYGTSARDGAFEHWSQRGHTPPNDIASAYYPLRGLYSSSDQLVTAQQMEEIRAAGIDEIAVSWWGQSSPEDIRLPEVVAAAQADGISVAVHLEPYGGRTVASTVADLVYLRRYGIRTFYVYRPLDLAIADWAAAKTALHADGKARESIRKTRTAVAMVLDHERITPNVARDPSVKLPREEPVEVQPPSAADANPTHSARRHALGAVFMRLGP
jgi:hypothetical protein